MSDVMRIVPSFGPQDNAKLSPELQSAPSFPCETDSDQISDTHREHHEVITQHTPAPSIASYEETLSLYKQGRFVEAEKNLLNLTENSPEAIALLARIYANQGKLNDALVLCDKAVVLKKLNPGFHYLRAMILQEQGETEKAIKSLKHTLYLEPDFVLAHFAMGNLLLQQGKIEESEKHFRIARMILKNHDQADVLPESDGVTVGRLLKIISYMAESEVHI